MSKELTGQIKAKDKWINFLLTENAEMQEAINKVLEYWIDGAYTEETWDEQLSNLEALNTKHIKRGCDHVYADDFVMKTQ